MKKVRIDKTVVLDQKFERIEQLTCHEKIQTTAAVQGLECSGFIEIIGTGIAGDSQIPLHEMIDLSIFAPFRKLSDTEQFSVNLSGYEIELNGNELNCQFEFDVSGLIEDTEEKNETESEEASIEDLLDDSLVVNEKVRYGLTYSSDTYLSIASRYGVDEKEVRRLNHNKTLSGRMLILLPLG